MKKFALLGLILLLGLVLRSYNLDFPSIGYHNMKENDYLSIAQEMQRTGDYVTRRIYFWNAFEDNPTMRLYPQPPLVSYQILLSWKILGENIWGPRLFNILFGLGAILVIYFTAFLLFKNTARALAAAFLMAVMPLAVFFSRNLQPESPGLFFMLWGSLFYLKFIDSFKARNLIFAGIAFSFAWLYKFSFLIGAMPFVFCFPFKKIFSQNRKRIFKYALAFILPYLIILAAIIWLKSVGQWEFAKVEIGRVKIFALFSPRYWQEYGRMIWWYIKGENYTLVFFGLGLVGTALAFLRRKTLLDRYLIGLTITAIFYCMFFSDYVNQHSYYQMPFLGFVCLAIVYALDFFSEVLKKYAKKELFVFLLVVSAGISAPFIRGAIDRMFATVYLGEDVAGESLGELTEPNERIFLYTYPQGYAISRYARRYVGWADNLKDFKNKEEKFRVRFVCFYPADFARQLEIKYPEIYEYLKANYHVKEVGLTEEPSNLSYIILEKGAAKPEEQKEFLKAFSGNKQLRTIYKLFGRYIFFYSLRT